MVCPSILMQQFPRNQSVPQDGAYPATLSWRPVTFRLRRAMVNKRIRQGQSRFKTESVVGHGGLVDTVYIYHCMVIAVRPHLVIYFDGQHIRGMSHSDWTQTHSTRRKAWAAAWAEVRKTDLIRNAEYIEAWEEDEALQNLDAARRPKEPGGIRTAVHRRR